MGKPLNIILIAFITLLSFLPFFVLYLISDLICFILFRIVRYRRKVVFQNLKNSFPQKEDEALQLIAKKYYRHLSDLMVETIKSKTVHKRYIERHIRFEDPHFYYKYIQAKQPVMIMMAHMGNWEWASFSFTFTVGIKSLVVYRPLSNQAVDNFYYKMRSRFGAIPVKMQSIYREMVKLKNTPSVVAMISDQSPVPETACWLTFLNQDTPFFMGGSKMAQKTGFPVVYAGIRKEKRGKYVISMKELVANPNDLKPEEIVKAFANQLEKDIREQPEIWLWSHKRWKHKKPNVSRL